MASEREHWKEESQQNAKTLEAEIERLGSEHGDFLGLRQFQYREFWAHAKQISGMFRTLKPLLPSDREQLWAKFSSLCEDTRKAGGRKREAAPSRYPSAHRRGKPEYRGWPV